MTADIPKHMAISAMGKKEALNHENFETGHNILHVALKLHARSTKFGMNAHAYEAVSLTVQKVFSELVDIIW